MKELCIFFIIFTVSLAALPQVSGSSGLNCTDQTTYCVKLNGKCSADAIFNKDKCTVKDLLNAKSDPICCSGTQICVNGSCANDNVGNNCTSDAMCYAQTGLNLCYKGFCTIMGGAGDTCSSSGKGLCFSGTVNLTTTTLQCATNSSKCSGIAEGGACINYDVKGVNLCGSGLYCAGATCQKFLSLTSKCNVTSAPCPPAYQCNSGTCTKIGSVATNSKCENTILGSLLCDSGNVCSNGTCISAKTSKLKSCSNTTECSSISTSSTCECAPGSGKSYCSAGGVVSLGGNDQAISLVTCLANANCSFSTYGSFVFMDMLKYSCATENCNSECKKYIEAEICDGATTGGSCSASTYCSGFPVWAIVVIVVVAVILVLSVVVVIFLVLRKKRESYSSI